MTAMTAYISIVFVTVTEDAALAVPAEKSVLSIISEKIFSV